MPRSRPVTLCFALLSIVIFSTLCFAAVPDRIAGPINASQLYRLHTGGLPMQARSGVDEGAVDPSLKLEYITLLTAPSSAQQKALAKLLVEQQTPHSASYHKWLTPEQYAAQFGLSINDMSKLTSWLRAQGFSIVRTAHGNNWVVFSGTASQEETAFQTQIHNFKVGSETHFANVTPPAIPAALQGVVTGLRGLNNFRPKSNLRKAAGYTFPSGENDYFFIAPGDVTTMYDLSTLYGSSITGTDQKLAVMGETGIFQSDLTNFRQNFGLSAISCSTSSDVITFCNTSNFQYVLVNGTPTEIYGDLPEADIDIEWSGATAPAAQVIFVTSNATDVWDSWYYAVDNSVAPVITMSYTAPCEYYEAGFTGEGSIVSDEAELMKANAEGITFMNSAGDTGAAECDYQSNLAQNGYAVAYPASSPEVTGVGGTSIPAIAPNEYTSQYWSSTTGSDGGSVTGYVPEQAWNDSQEFGLLCTTASPCTLNGETVTDWTTAQTAIGISAGGGGVSNCTSVDNDGVCNGGFAQPIWQAGLTLTAINPSGAGQVNSTATRLSPDVSLLASSNFPGYLVCTQINGSSGGGSSCDSPTTGITDMLTACFAGTGPCTIYGGTSVSSPIFAGMVTLFNQDAVANGLQSAPGLGNINPTLYSLAASNGTNGAFNPVTTASTGAYSDGAWCAPGTPSSGVPGDPWPTALTCPSSGSAFLGFNAYDSDPATGYNLATGLGSVNASHFAAALLTQGAATTTTVASSSNPANFGASVTFTATVVTSGSSAPTGTVTFNNGSTSIGTGTLSTVGGAQVATVTTSSLPSGSDSITAVYGGDSSNAGSTSAVLTQVIVGPTFSVTNTGATTATVLSGQSASVYSFTVTPTGGATTFFGTVTFSCSFSPADPTLTNTSCVFTPSSIPAGSPAAAGANVTLSIVTAGPNPDGGVRKQLRRHADNRLPWLPLSLPLAGVVMVGFAGRKLSKYSVLGSLCLALVLAGLLIACGSSSHPIVVSGVAANPTSVFPNDSADNWPTQTSNISVSITNDSQSKGVTWSAVTGTIASTGATTATYTAPTIAAGLPGTDTITATSVADPTKTAQGTITLTPATVPGTYGVTVTVTQTGAAAPQTLPLTIVVQ